MNGAVLYWDATASAPTDRTLAPRGLGSDNACFPGPVPFVLPQQQLLRPPMTNLCHQVPRHTCLVTQQVTSKLHLPRPQRYN